MKLNATLDVDVLALQQDDQVTCLLTFDAPVPADLANRPGESLDMQLVDGPFSRLEGTWLFLPLPRPGSEQLACKIEFDLRYAFASKALEAVVSPVFDRVANTFVDSFVRRAEVVYGAR